MLAKLTYIGSQMSKERWPQNDVTLQAPPYMHYNTVYPPDVSIIRVRYCATLFLALSEIGLYLGRMYACKYGIGVGARTNMFKLDIYFSLTGEYMCIKC